MIIAFDTYYYDNKAKTVGVSFNKWEDDKPIEIYSEIIEGVAEYEPGSFYKRELPCIMSLLKKISLDKIDLIIVDSYVILDDNGKLGLGGHLF
ncbi:MAG: endonuclease V, partial [Maribacter sp.]